MKTYRQLVFAFAILCSVCGPASAAVRIKDITHIEGVRANQLYGLGLVIGLDARDVLPAEAVSLVQACLAEEVAQETLLDGTNGRRQLLRIEPLEIGGAVNGCLIMLLEGHRG